MKSSITSCTLAVLAGISLLSQASAQVTIDWVSVENLNNAADPATGSLYGAVSYGYKIAKYETTIAQYTVFLNAVAKSDPYGLYNPTMGTDLNFVGISRTGDSGNYSYSVIGSGNRPISYVSWFDAARFTNWLHNGQPVGDQTALTTEDGAYTLNGATSGYFTKNAGATVWLPSENEWYKAAYYDPTKGGSGGYWLYPNKSDTITTADANYGNSVGTLTNVGNYSSDPSFYGTFDMGGNVWEWNEAIIGSFRGLRGGSWFNVVNDLASSYRGTAVPWNEVKDIGFRLASVPEPSGLVLTMLIGAGFICHRRRSL